VSLFIFNAYFIRLQSMSAISFSFFLSVSKRHYICYIATGATSVTPTMLRLI